MSSLRWKIDDEAGCGLPSLDRDPSIDLLCKPVDELQPERSGAVEIKVLRQADPIVANVHADPAVSTLVETHVDLPPTIFRKGVFQRIRQQFIHDQSARDGDVDAEECLAS